MLEGVTGEGKGGGNFAAAIRQPAEDIPYQGITGAPRILKANRISWNLQGIKIKYQGKIISYNSTQSSGKDDMVKEEKREVSRDAVLKRLRRIEGQIRGLQKMVAEERECESIVAQLAAVRSAIDGVGALVLNNYIKICAPKGGAANPAVYESMVRVVGVWGRVRLGE